MIHLDTSTLIDITTPGSAAAARVAEWLDAEITLAVSAIAWFEYTSGPVTAEAMALVKAAVKGGIVPFDDRQAGKAAEFFNVSGRKRALKFDCMIAAAAITANARLATSNQADFSLFLSMGLQLEVV